MALETALGIFQFVSLIGTFGSDAAVDIAGKTIATSVIEGTFDSVVANAMKLIVSKFIESASDKLLESLVLTGLTTELRGLCASVIPAIKGKFTTDQATNA